MSTFRYFCAVDEVLTSVHKTEESLRRLKTLREKSSSSSQMTSSTEKPFNITDDDKIRTQLYVDVGHWSKRIEEMGIAKAEVERLDALLALVNQFSMTKGI